MKDFLKLEAEDQYQDHEAIPSFEVEPEESFEVDQDVTKLIRRAAAARRMNPDAFLAILIHCVTCVESSQPGAGASKLASRKAPPSRHSHQGGLSG
jgi:hypothetical protein